jgi:ubiquinone/menaquinone biosynthesis C-methylase UbiE
MRYIPSHEVKGAGVYYEGIRERVPWVMGDGTLDKLTQVYLLKERKHILDIGCGNGMTLDYFASTASKLVGIDLNNYLSVPSKERIAFSVVDLNFEKLPYTDRAFDLIFALQVMEHLENPFYFMRETHRVLTDDGLFIMSVPNPFTFSSKLRFFLTGNARRWKLGNDHLLFLTKDVMQKTYGTHFDIVHTYYQRGLIPFIGRFYTYFGIKPTVGNSKFFPRIEAFGDSMCFVMKKKQLPTHI